MKIALLVMFELRALSKTIQDIYSKVIDYYNADVYILCQQQFEDDDARLKLFDRNVKYAGIYEKPDCVDYFGKDSNYHTPTKQLYNYWKRPSCLQFIINKHKFADILRPITADYDYFISLRTDTQILFDFPSISVLERAIPGVYSTYPKYTYNWNGSGIGHIVHSSYIIDYLTCEYDTITNKQYAWMFETIDMNQESLFEHSLILTKNVPLRMIKHTNHFYTTIGLEDYTTCATPAFHTSFGVYYKYLPQCEEAFANLDAWTRGYKWGCVHGNVQLVPPTHIDDNSFDEPLHRLQKIRNEGYRYAYYKSNTHSLIKVNRSKIPPFKTTIVDSIHIIPV
jgi:hypothetical protein